MFVLENASYGHTQIIKSSYEAINDFFSAVLSGTKDFSKDIFTEYLSDSEKGWPDNTAVELAFDNVDSKNADFIAYMFYQMTGKEKQLSNWGDYTNWGDYMNLVQEISDLLVLGDEYDQPIALFDYVWPLSFE